jgi:hypothetical protein
MDNRPLSEQAYEAGLDYSDKNAAASLLEDLKSSVLSRMMAALGEMAVNKAEMKVKASNEWVIHVTSIVEARREADNAKFRHEYLRARFAEWQSEQANERTAARL